MSPEISREMITAAAGRVAPFVRETPVLEVSPVTAGTDYYLSLKLELLQHTGSFKVRGAFNNALQNNGAITNIAAASGGNHGIAVAHVGKTLGMKASVFVSGASSPVKVNAIRALEADLELCGNSYDEAQRACADYVKRTGAHHVHPFDAPSTIAGQGTVGLEWTHQSPDLDVVLVAAGGGGLISGIASWYVNSGTRIVGVEPKGANALYAALNSGGPVDVEIDSIASDSLGPISVTPRIHRICEGLLDQIILVSDDAIKTAQAHLWNAYRIAAEPGGATAFAALISGAYVPPKGCRIGVLICGGNVDLRTVASN